jgi:hypothetical protein
MARLSLHRLGRRQGVALPLSKMRRSRSRPRTFAPFVSKRTVPNRLLSYSRAGIGSGGRSEGMTMVEPITERATYNFTVKVYPSGQLYIACDPLAHF